MLLLANNSTAKVVLSYDVASRLTQMNVDSATYLNGISYNTSSQVIQLTTGSSMSHPRVENYSYDSQTGLLTGQTVKNTAATSTYLDLTYSYTRGSSHGSVNGKTGQLTKIVDNLNNNRDKLYEFDSVGRLMKAHGGVAAGASGVTANWTQNYTYDRYGNKTATSVSGDLEDTTRAPRDGLSSVSINTATNRVNTSGWEYDLAGNLIRGKDGTAWQKFEYDAAGRLVKIKNDSNTVLETYTYGASRERLMVETSSGRRYFAWGGQNVVAEYVETGSGTTPEYSKSYIYAGSRLFMTAIKASSSTETKEFHHPDRLGTQLVTEGSTGSSFRQSTMPFGTTISTETTGNTNQVFTSYDRSATTGLDYAQNRTYSKGQSRFTQVDPIGMNSASAGSPQSNNLYSYVQNMPTDFLDPSGLFIPSENTQYGSELRVVSIFSGGIVAMVHFLSNISFDILYEVDSDGNVTTFFELFVQVGGSSATIISPGSKGGTGVLDHGTGTYSPPKGSSPLAVVGWVNNFCSTAQGPPPHPNARWRGPDGRFYKGPFSIQKAAKIGSRATFGVGTAVSIGQMATGDVSPWQGSLDIFMGGVGAFGGPKGWVLAGGYFAYQATPPPAYPQHGQRAVSTNTCHGGRR